MSGPAPRIKLTLKTVDDAGQEASERNQDHPAAAAAVLQSAGAGRSSNSAHPGARRQQKRRVLDLIDAITLRPEDTFDNMSHYLGTHERALAPQAWPRATTSCATVVYYLWEIALSASRTATFRRPKSGCARRRRRCKQALENGASDEEIDKLMKELRQAMNDFLREFAERARAEPEPGRADAAERPGTAPERPRSA